MRLRDLKELDERLKLLARYEATGLTPEQVACLKRWPFPRNDDFAPLPMSDPAMDCVEAYEDSWDYPAQEQQKQHTGLLCDDA